MDISVRTYYCLCTPVGGGPAVEHDQSQSIQRQLNKTDPWLPCSLLISVATMYGSFVLAPHGIWVLSTSPLNFEHRKILKHIYMKI
jgi:hypothetical protein